jgi:hypothetical protein
MDKDAINAIRKAFAEGPPFNSTTIPQRAREELGDRARGPERISRAIDDMVRSGKLNASPDPYRDWELRD